MSIVSFKDFFEYNESTFKLRINKLESCSNISPKNETNLYSVFINGNRTKKRDRKFSKFISGCF